MSSNQLDASPFVIGCIISDNPTANDLCFLLYDIFYGSRCGATHFCLVAFLCTSCSDEVCEMPLRGGIVFLFLCTSLRFLDEVCQMPLRGYDLFGWSR